MSSPFERLDAFLLDRAAQPAANWLSHRLDLDHFAVARGLLQVRAVASLAFIGAHLVETPRGWLLAAFTLLAMFVYPFCLMENREAERACLRGYLNPRRAKDQGWRLCLLLFTAMKIPGLLAHGLSFAWTVDGISILCLTAAVYLAAANLPPPPSTSTQSAWRDAMATGSA
jgi:hypothetical protein